MNIELAKNKLFLMEVKVAENIGLTISDETCCVDIGMLKICCIS
jgi:hypothetical protein